MNGIIAFKNQLQEFYANYSRIIDKVARFLLAIICFMVLNKNIGYMHALTNPIVSVGLSAICAFLPTAFTALFAAAVVLAHVYKISIVVAAIVGVVFFLMFIFYIRFAPKTAVAVLLMPVAFMLRIPVVVPVAFSLVFGPVYAVSVALGTMSYYMLRVIEKVGDSAQSADGESIITLAIDLIKQIFQNKEMWVAMIASILCVFVVYGIRKSAVAHAWKVASVAGALLYVVVMKAGASVFGVKVSMSSLGIGVVLAVVVGLILELIFFAVDYKKCESLEYEDDEYYYYVKAVPKVGVSASKKSRNQKDEDYEEAEVIDAEELRRSANNQNRKSNGRNKQKQNINISVQQGRKQSSGKKKKPMSKENDLDHAEQLLLTQSLKKDLNL